MQSVSYVRLSLLFCIVSFLPLAAVDLQQSSVLSVVASNQKKDWNALSQLFRFVYRHNQIVAIDPATNTEAGHVTISLRGDTDGYINHLYVNRSYRGQGLGSVLLQQGIKALSEQGCTKVSLNAYPLDDVHGTSAFEKNLIRLMLFYHRLGFLQTQEGGNYMNAYAPFNITCAA